ncbi:Metallo-dependent phosphatase-like protein, partial [Hysterangium stoloniferum]
MLRKVNHRRLLQLRSKVSPISGLRLFWVVAVLWWEYGSFVWNVAWCRWPKQPGSTAFHLLLVADPQVPRPTKGWVPTLGWLKHHIVNHNLRKGWSAAKGTKPQAVVFLGDMLRQGSKTADMAEYGEYADRFKSIFHIKKNIPRYYVPGNHDVGLGSDRAISVRIRDRFESHFEPTNQIIQADGHILVLLDAPALVEEDYRRHGAGLKFDDWLGVPGGSIGFLKSIANTHHTTPIVLFSHIPLWRPDGASCGPLREFGNIRRGVGRGYQSMLGKETSRFVLESVAPSIVFSADDHDYCDYIHPPHIEDPHSSSVREVTVKSFSMATKVRQPGFQLLSLFTPQEANSHPHSPSYADSICLLPNQSSIYTRGYLPLFAVTIAILLILNLRRPNS